MTKANSKSDRIRAKIDESEAELSSRNAVSTTRLPESEPPEQFTGLIGDYPGLAIAAGLGFGLLAGALLPRSAGRKLARGVVFLASAGGELGLALGKQALLKADEATRDHREKLGETATGAANKVADAGRDVGRMAAAAGRKAGANAQRIAEGTSERARDVGTGVAKAALDAAARIRH